jgi:broad-specificity NMP kinase
MKNWDYRNEQIDERLDGINNLTKEWHQRLIETGKLIDESDEKIKDLTVEVDKVNDDLQWSNKKLKGIIEQYSKPHKFCIYIVLILLLVGLLIGIIKLANG